MSARKSNVRARDKREQILFSNPNKNIKNQDEPCKRYERFFFVFVYDQNHANKHFLHSIALFPFYSILDDKITSNCYKKWIQKVHTKKSGFKNGVV